MMDVLMLSRMQFAANITFHILFPTITIALAWVLLYFKIQYNKTKKEQWMDAYRFWVKIFALSFALGVVTGITMSFQFGTNWPGFMEKVGNIAGPLLAYEVMTAFFLEATFLGIMLFGFNRVSNRIHTTATVLVAVGTSMSAFWILVLNSWMQTPVGFEWHNGVVHATDWFEIMFNPSMPYRMIHMLLASGLTCAFLISGVSAYRWLHHDRSVEVMQTIKTGVFLASFLIPLQILVGDLHGLNTLKYQPQKVAAMEGIWDTERGAGLRLFAIPDDANRLNRFEITVPKAASIILMHDVDGEIKGVNDFDDHPPVAAMFYAFRIMVGVGLLMLLIAWSAALKIYRTSSLTPWLARGLFLMTFSGWVATVAGWYTTEIGRQPWLVQGVLRTKDAVSDVSSHAVFSTLVAYLIVYAVLLVAYISTIFYLARKANKPMKTS